MRNEQSAKWEDVARGEEILIAESTSTVQISLHQVCALRNDCATSQAQSDLIEPQAESKQVV